MLGKILKSGIKVLALSVVFSNFAFAVANLKISSTAVDSTKIKAVSLSPNAGDCFTQATNLMNDYIKSVNSCVSTSVTAFNDAITAANNAYEAATANKPSAFVLNKALSAFNVAVNKALAGTGCNYDGSQTEDQLAKCFLNSKTTSCKATHASKLTLANTKKTDCCTDAKSQMNANDVQIGSLDKSMGQLKTDISAKQAQIKALQADVENLNKQFLDQTKRLFTLMTKNSNLNSLLNANSCSIDSGAIKK